MKYRITMAFGVFIILSALLMSSCLSAPESGASSSRSGGKEPGWVANIDGSYDPDDYLAVLGQGDSLTKAQAKAASNLALIFENRISVDSTIESRYVELSQNGTLAGTSEETSMSDTISQLSDQTLMNVKYGESWTNDMGQVITVAYLDRDETERLYVTRMKEQADVLNRLKSEGDRADSKIARYAYYDAAYVIAAGNEVMKQQLEIISPSSAMLAGSSYDLAEVKSARTGASEDMTFRMAFTGDDEGRAGNVMSDKLTDMGFLVSPAGDIAVNGSLRSEKIDRANDYQNYKWYLLIDMVDENGNTVVSVDESGISASTSESAAKSRVNVDVEKVINKEFEKQFNAYLNGFLTK